MEIDYMEHEYTERNRVAKIENTSEANLLVPQRTQCFRFLEGIENNVFGAVTKICIRILGHPDLRASQITTNYYHAYIKKSSEMAQPIP